MTLELRGDLDDIRCHISRHSLEAAPVYSALSYEWGDPEDAVDILIDGKMFSVRHNLWLFLHSMKVAALQQECSECAQKQTSQLCIDAVCIDQTNTSERNAQVQLMGRMYRDAQEVVIWLGWSEDLRPDVASILRGLLVTHLESNNQRYPRFVSGQFCCTYEFCPVIEENVTQEIWQFLANVCRKSYWTRRWIFQEVLFSKKQFLSSGTTNYLWKQLA